MAETDRTHACLLILALGGVIGSDGDEGADSLPSVDSALWTLAACAFIRAAELLYCLQDFTSRFKSHQREGHRSYGKSDASQMRSSMAPEQVCAPSPYQRPSVLTTSKAQQQKPPILRLSPEILDQIIISAVVSNDYIAVHQDGPPWTRYWSVRPAIPPFASTCRLLRAKTMRISFGQNCFWAQNATQGLTWLAKYIKDIQSAPAVVRALGIGFSWA